MEEETKKLSETSTTMETAGSEQIETNVTKDKVGAEEVKASDNLRQSVHLRVECDGCGVAPITGARYKCTVCKNFDYCENCEQTKGHPHAFLKINNPDQAPRAMFTVVNEDMPNVQNVDGEVKEGETPAFGRGMPWCRGGWRRFMRGGHHGHQHGHGPHHPHPLENMTPEEFAKKMENWGQCMGEWGKKLAEAHAEEGAEKIDPEIMKKKVGFFMRKMFKGGCGEKTEGQGKGGCPWKKGGCWKKEGGNGRMNPCRAVPVNVPETITVCAGDELEAEVTFRNDTAWPYKQGFHLENVPENSSVYVAPIKVPVAEIAGKTNFIVKVPIKISEAVESCVRNNVEHYVLAVGMTNIHGCKVGQEAQIKIRVIEKIDEMQLYDKVMQLEAFSASSNTETQEPIDFLEAVAALKEGDYDVNRAYEILQKKKLSQSVQPEMVDNDGDNLYD